MLFLIIWNVATTMPTLGAIVVFYDSTSAVVA